MLLPVVASAARRSDLKDAGERIARSELRVLPATLDIDGARGLPVPLAWGKLKDAPPPDVDTIVSGVLDKRTRGRPVKLLRRGFIAPSGDHAVAFQEKAVLLGDAAGADNARDRRGAGEALLLEDRKSVV